MKISVGSAWKAVALMVKVAGSWKRAKVFNHVGGVWKRVMGGLPTRYIYEGSIVIGTANPGYTVYGFYSGQGVATPNVVKQGGGFYFITGSKDYAGVGPYQWIEMAVAGDVSAQAIDNLSINGVIGELVLCEYNATYTTTYIQWVFPAQLPLTGTWDVIV